MRTGTVSHGTLRIEGLLDAFKSELFDRLLESDSDTNRDRDSGLIYDALGLNP